MQEELVYIASFLSLFQTSTEKNHLSIIDELKTIN